MIRVLFIGTLSPFLVLLILMSFRAMAGTLDTVRRSEEKADLKGTTFATSDFSTYDKPIQFYSCALLAIITMLQEKHKPTMFSVYSSAKKIKNKHIFLISQLILQSYPYQS